MNNDKDQLQQDSANEAAVADAPTTATGSETLSDAPGSEEKVEEGSAGEDGE